MVICHVVGHVAEIDFLIILSLLSVAQNKYLHIYLTFAVNAVVRSVGAGLKNAVGGNFVHYFLVNEKRIDQLVLLVQKVGITCVVVA